jgi:hypothetical protein
VRRFLPVAALVLLLGAGAVVGYVLYKRHEARNIRGSPTQEFVTTEATKPAIRTPEIVWPTYGYDNERVKAVTGFNVRPPYSVQWAFRARKLLEFPPVIAYGKLYIANNLGVLFAIEARTGHEKWHSDARRCTAASPAVANRLVYQVFLNRPPPAHLAPARQVCDDLAVEAGALRVAGRTVEEDLVHESVRNRR